MSFREECYRILKKVPSGKVTTYKEIARALNSRAYRAVGSAMNKNPYYSRPRTALSGKQISCLPRNRSAPIVPCHRVVNSDGKVGGFAKGKDAKVKMLEEEGVEIIDGKIDFKKYLYKL